MAALAVAAPVLLFACVRFAGLPDMPAGMASDPAIYAIEKKAFPANVQSARLMVRASNISWTLVGTAGENLASSQEIREKFGGVIFVGDSQIREVAWAALQMLTLGQTKRFAAHDKAFARQRAPGKAACVPQSIGKTGFTASCGPQPTPGTEGGPGSACDLHSPFHNKSHAEAMRRLLLTKPHAWDGKLSVNEAVCHSDFFLSYQATWGAMPADPLTVPSCLHPGADSNGAYALRHERLKVTKPILWVVDGCGLHEMEFCDARRWSLPQHVLPRFPPSLLQSGTVVWQTVGAGFLMRAANRFRGECKSVNADQVAAKEVEYLRGTGVRVYNYTSLALQYAPLMFDAIHFTYYWVPCAYTFPEMARLVAQLGFQLAVGRPVEVCPPGTPSGPPLSLPPRHVPLGMPGGASVSLAQDEEQSLSAYTSAFKLAGKSAVSAFKAHKDLKKAAANAATTSSTAGGSGADDATAAQTATTDGSGGSSATPSATSLATAIHQVAVQFGPKKTDGQQLLQAQIAKLVKQYGAHD